LFLLSFQNVYKVNHERNFYSPGPGGPPRTGPLRIGSVKTNIGYTGAASGLASVIKVVLALEKGQLPPTVNFETPNPKLRLDEWNLKVAIELEP
jgi:acyl transferase domain-containing protein